MKKKKSLVLILLIVGVAVALIVDVALIFFYTLEPQSDVVAPDLHAVAEPQFNDVRTESTLKAVIIPHHDVVKKQRAQLLSTIAKKVQPKTIILISPNHFGSGDHDIVTTDQTWQLSNGRTITPATLVMDALSAAIHLPRDPLAFSNEHGIKNILDDIDTYFPDAQLLSVILKDDTDATAVAEFGTALVQACPDCLLIASIDASHYLPAHVADVHDVLTIRALTKLDETTAWKAEIDSNPSMALLLFWAKKQSATHFHLVNHTNSGLLDNNLDVEGTSHVCGYYDGLVAKEAAPDAVTFTFGGDVMLGRFVGNHYQNNYRDLFTRFGNRVFWGTDIAWVNLEGMVSDTTVAQSIDPNDLFFLFSRSAIQALQYLHINIVGLGNNHSWGLGAPGYVTTTTMLDDGNVTWHGHPQEINDQSVARFDRNGVSVSLIAVNMLSSPADDLIRRIQQEDRAHRMVIVLPHWGIELEATHARSQEVAAKEWIDAGADLIVGSHPHVIQDVGMYRDRLIFYSLGNFVFDQTFLKETQQSLLLTGMITSNRISVVLMPVESKNFQPALMQGAEKQMIIQKLCAELGRVCEDDRMEIDIPLGWMEVPE